MSKVIGFMDARKRFLDQQSFNDLLGNAQQIGKLSLGIMEEGVFRLGVDAKTYFVASINSILLNERHIDAELFRCALYIGGVFEELLHSVPDCYFICDYYLKGFERKDPFYLQKGADLCWAISVFFRDFANRRCMREEDYLQMGIALYYAYYLQTNKYIGWCMSNNFKSIVTITRKGIKEMGTKTPQLTV
jgi:hypothetical protein